MRDKGTVCTGWVENIGIKITEPQLQLKLRLSLTNIISRHIAVDILNVQEMEKIKHQSKF